MNKQDSEIKQLIKIAEDLRKFVKHCRAENVFLKGQLDSLEKTSEIVNLQVSELIMYAKCVKQANKIQATIDAPDLYFEQAKSELLETCRSLGLTENSDERKLLMETFGITEQDIENFNKKTDKNKLQ